jgi:transposase
MYSMDFRRLAVERHEACGSSAEVAEEMGCSEAWVRRQSQHLRERGTIEPGSRARKDDQRAYDDADEEKIRALIADKPDATLAEVIAAIGKPASPASASRTLKRLGLGRKKSPRTPPSRTGPT